MADASASMPFEDHMTKTGAAAGPCHHTLSCSRRRCERSGRSTSGLTQASMLSPLPSTPLCHGHLSSRFLTIVSHLQRAAAIG